MIMPVLFAAHGSPMNAIADNPFTRALQALGKALPTPKAILAISAHWLTPNTQVLASAQPRTIHDFSGFDPKLYQIQYAAPGAPELAEVIQKLLGQAEQTQSWGLDHGTWSVLVHLFPKADIPVLQLSLNQTLSFEAHWELASNLKPLREQGVLIMGSGNIVHNLAMLEWHHPEKGSAKTIAFDEGIKEAILKRDFEKLRAIQKYFPDCTSYAVPTTDHYLPLLYTAAVSSENDNVTFPVTGYDFGSLSMRSVLWQET